MRKIIRGLTPGILVLGTIFAAAPASAATTSTNLNVSATVTANCTVTSSPIAFGNVNPLSGANVDATGGITVTCTNGTAWSAAAGVGGGTGATFASRKMTFGANLLDYTIYTDAARTSVWGDGTGTTATINNNGTGNAQAVTVYGRVPSGQVTVPPGAYADVVAVTVTY